MSDNENKEIIPKPKKPFNFKLLLELLVSCTLVYSIYRLLLNYYQPEFVLIGYMVTATVLIFIYIIYNRGFSRKGITVDMLPESWDEEKKSEFLASAERRLKKSKPLLIVIIAFIFTFFVDIMELLVIPFFVGMLGG